MFLTLTAHLCSALLRLLPVGESENAPLPFSATSAFPHGIASPLPAVSESGKVKPPLLPPPPKCFSLPVCPTVSVSVFARLRLDLTFQPETIVLPLSCVHVVFVSVSCKKHRFDGNPFKTIKCICQPSIAVCLTQMSSIPQINYLWNRK